MTRRGTSRRLRYAPPLAAVPVQSAIVLVAFAGIGGTPVNRSAGKGDETAASGHGIKGSAESSSEEEEDGGFDRQGIRCIRKGAMPPIFITFSRIAPSDGRS